MAIVLVGTGGSSGRTLSAVEAALRTRRPGETIRFVDTQPFNLRSGGRTFYSGSGEVRVAVPEACGMRRFTRSWSLNMLLNGGPRMYARMKRYGRRLIGDDADVIVMCHDRIYIETALIEAAHRIGAATVLIQEGPFCSIGHGDASAPVLRLKHTLAPLITATGLLPKMPDYGCAGHTRVLAASTAYRDRWIKAGVPAEQVGVAGIPRYDSLADRQHGRAARASGPLRVLYLTQPFAAHGKVRADVAARVEAIVARGLQEAHARMDLDVTIRLHPRADEREIAAIRDAVGEGARIDLGDRGLETVLAEYDVVLGHYSSGLLESLLAGKRILCVPVPEDGFAESSEGAKQVWLTRTGAPVATTAEMIAECLAAARMGAPMTIDWDMVAGEVGEVDGNSAMRIAANVLEILDRRGQG